MRALSRAVERTSERTPPRQVTDRERDVLNALLEGLSNKEIAGKLGISEGSVKSALQQLFIKTGVRTRSQLVRVAVEEYATQWRLQR
jgi:DNA-binding NarL/FixJ family response regulator